MIVVNGKLIEADTAELVTMFGPAVRITAESMRESMPMFHKASDLAPCDALATMRVGSDVTLPVAHAAKFAVPCDECYPIEGNGADA